MTNESMIERVAEAIGATFAEEQERLVDAAMAADGSLTGIADEMMAKCARAAIEALRNPTEAMTRAAMVEADKHGYQHTKGYINEEDGEYIFRAMIDAALVIERASDSKGNAMSDEQKYANQMQTRGPNEQRYINLMMTTPADKVPSVHGSPRDMSNEEYYGILADALERGQNVLFGGGYQDQSIVPQYASPHKPRGFWAKLFLGA